MFIQSTAGKLSLDVARKVEAGAGFGTALVCGGRCLGTPSPYRCLKTILLAHSITHAPFASFHSLPPPRSLLSSPPPSLVHAPFSHPRPFADTPVPLLPFCPSHAHASSVLLQWVGVAPPLTRRTGRRFTPFSLSGACSRQRPPWPRGRRHGDRAHSTPFPTSLSRSLHPLSGV